MSTDLRADSASSDSKTRTWGACLKVNWKPFSLNPWKLFLDCRAAKIVTVEPIVFLYLFNTFLFLFTLQQYFFWRFGKEQLANSSFPDLNRSSFCISTDDLNEYGRNNETANDVQTSSGRLMTYSTVPGLLLSVIVALVLGPLSDKYGRRLIFFLMGIGVLVQGVLAFLIVWFELNIHLFILDIMLASFFGGFARASCHTASLAYAADISSGKWRTIRIAMIEAMEFLGAALSQGTAGVLLWRLQCAFWPLLMIHITCSVLLLVYVIFLLPESLSKNERASHHPHGIQALARGFKIFFCPSEYSTWKLWLVLVVLNVMVTIFIGAQEITAFFLLGEPLKWRVDLIGYYGLVTSLTHGLVLIVIAPILVALSLSDAVISLIGLAFCCSMKIFTGFVKETWQMFLGKELSCIYIVHLIPVLSLLTTVAVLEGMEAVIIVSTKSILSKEVSAGDQGMGMEVWVYHMKPET